MNFSTNFTSLCSLSKSIAASPFSAILSAEIITGVISIIPNILLLVAVSRAKVYPANLRYLLANFSFCLVFQSVANTAKASTTLNLGLKDPCSLIVSLYSCKIQEAPQNVTVTIIFFALLAISLERLYCAIRYRNQDYSSSSPAVAIVFLIIMWIFSLVTSINNLSGTPKGLFIPICDSSLAVSGQSMAAPMAISLAIEILPLFIIILVRAYDQYNLKNTAINRVQHTLNFRFQLIQSAQMNAVIVPSLFLHAVCYLPTLILYFTVAYGVRLETDTKWRLFHACTIYRLIYTFAHPLLAFHRNPRLAQQLKKGALARMTAKVWNRTATTSKQQQIPAVAISPHRGTMYGNNLNFHFNVLENVWAAGPNKKR